MHGRDLEHLDALLDAAIRMGIVDALGVAKLMSGFADVL